MKNRISLGLLIFSIAIGLAACQINVPMFSDNEYYYINMVYGTKSCEQLTALVEDSSNYFKRRVIEQCGTNFISENKKLYRKYYSSPFSIGGHEGGSYITSSQSYLHSNIIGLTPYPSNFSSYGVLDSLYFNEKIKFRRFFFNVMQFNSSATELYEIGSFQLGEPDLTLLEKDAKFAVMKMSDSYKPEILIRDHIRTYGEIIPSFADTFRFEIYQAKGMKQYIPSSLFNKLIGIWEHQGVDLFIYLDISFQDSIGFRNIEQLRPIDIILIKQDGSDFVLTIEPNEFIEFDELRNCYRFAFMETQESKITISPKMLEKYYYGFDVTTRQVFLAKKSAQPQISPSL